MRSICAMFAILAVLAAAACGGGTNSAISPENTPAPAANTTNKPGNAPKNAPAKNEATDTRPPVDTVAFKRLAMTSPSGWVSLSKDGRVELESHIKKLPSAFDYVSAITAKKAPGSTEGADHWSEWSRHAVGATLYRVSPDSKEPEAALKEYADVVAAGVPEPKTEGGVAWTALQGGEVLLAALNNKHGTYLVVALIMDTPNLAAHQQAILKWAQSIKPE